MTRAETETIKCEACQGRRGFYSWEYDDTDNSGEWTECDLCTGTGREPTDVQARKHIEGVNPDG